MNHPAPLPRPGPCRICGRHPDQRHRTRDTQWGRIAAGEPVDQVAADYDTTPADMVAEWRDIDANLVEMTSNGAGR